MHSVGFLGGGRVARILIGGWARKGSFPATVLVHEPDDAAFEALNAVIQGALATLLDGGLSLSAVLDLVPVKPLVAMEPSITSAYRAALPALHAKIKPAQEAPSLNPV